MIEPSRFDPALSAKVKIATFMANLTNSDQDIKRILSTAELQPVQRLKLHIRLSFLGAADGILKKIRLTRKIQITEKIQIPLPPCPTLIKQCGEELTFKMLDCKLGIVQHEIYPLTMARRLPDEMKTKEFGDYARSLSLSHLTKVIEASNKLRTQKPQGHTPD